MSCFCDPSRLGDVLSIDLSCVLVFVCLCRCLIVGVLGLWGYVV